MLELNEINRDNFEAVIELSVHDDQRSFVASNVFSIAQAKAYPECIPMAVYADNTLVGFVMYGMDLDDNEYWISRLMIDKRYQKQGYGRNAMNCVLDKLERLEGYQKVYISFEPENIGAKRLYENMGFTPDGRVIDGEIVYCLQRRE